MMALRTLLLPGTKKQNNGGHCDVVVNNNRVYLYYFTHPGRQKTNPAKPGSTENRRSVIQLTELFYKNGALVCDRGKAVVSKLKKGK